MAQVGSVIVVSMLVIGALTLATLALAAAPAFAAKQTGGQGHAHEQGLPEARSRRKRDGSPLPCRNDNADRGERVRSAARATRFVGEIENVAPGLHPQFLGDARRPGKYDTYCPGGDRDYAVLLVIRPRRKTRDDHNHHDDRGSVRYRGAARGGRRRRTRPSGRVAPEGRGSGTAPAGGSRPSRRTRSTSPRGTRRSLHRAATRRPSPDHRRTSPR